MFLPRAIVGNPTCVLEYCRNTLYEPGLLCVKVKKNEVTHVWAHWPLHPRAYIYMHTWYEFISLNAYGDDSDGIVENVSTNWGWDTQRKMICNPEKEPSAMAGGSSREEINGEAPGTDGEAVPPHRADGPAAGPDSYRQLMIASCVRWHPSEQLPITSQFRPTWRHITDCVYQENSTEPCLVVLYGKSSQRGVSWSCLFFCTRRVNGSRGGENSCFARSLLTSVFHLCLLSRLHHRGKDKEF